MTPLDHYLDDRSDSVADIARRLVRAATAKGGVDIEVSSSKVVLHGSRRIFASFATTRDGLRGHLNLLEPVPDRRFTKIEPLTRHIWFHRFVLTSPEDLDETFLAWVRDAWMSVKGVPHRDGPHRSADRGLCVQAYSRRERSGEVGGIPGCAVPCVGRMDRLGDRVAAGKPLRPGRIAILTIGAWLIVGLWTRPARDRLRTSG